MRAFLVPCGLFVAALLVTTGACDTASPFERTNPRDPKSARYQPDAPEGLLAEAAAEGIVLRWDDVNLGEDGYLVERAYGAGAFDELDRLPPDATSYTDSTADALDLRYRVTGWSTNGGETASSEPAVVHIQPAPGDVQIDIIDEMHVRVSWVDALRFEEGYLIERRSGLEGEFEEIARVGANVTEYVDVGSVADERYMTAIVVDRSYRVLPFVGFDTGGSAEASVSDDLGALPLTVAEASGEGGVALQWDDPTGLATRFDVMRRAAGAAAPERIATLSKEARTFVDETAAVDESYRYQVRGAVLLSNQREVVHGPVYRKGKVLPVTGEVADVEVASDGSVAAVWTATSPVGTGTLHVFALPGGELLFEQSGTSRAAFAPGTSTLYYGTDGWLCEWHLDHGARWIGNGHTSDSDYIVDVAVHPEGALVVGATRAGAIYTFSVEERRRIAVVPNGWSTSSYASTLAFNADGTEIAVRRRDLLDFRDAVSLELIDRLLRDWRSLPTAFNQGQYVALAYDPVGRGLLSAVGHYEVARFDAEAHTFQKTTDFVATRPVFSRDGRFLFTGPLQRGGWQPIAVLDRATLQQQRRTVEAQPHGAYDVDRDGEVIVSGGARGEALVWSLDERAIWHEVICENRTAACERLYDGFWYPGKNPIDARGMER